MNPFFSVIVPTHNSQGYIRKGLNSIKEQTFTDYELIIICDSCTDNTINIAKQYTDKVYEIVAHSPGSSRNKGLEMATGQWILFMDDDDWFLHNYVFEMLHDRLLNFKKDFLVFSFIFNTRGYVSANLNIAAWSKAWRREFLIKNNIRFADTPVSEDVPFAEKAHKIGKAEYWDMPFYYYNYLRIGSLSYRMEQGEFSDEDSTT